MNSLRISFSAFRYTRNCEKLLAKFSAAFRQIESEFPKIEDFVRKYKVRSRSQIVSIIDGLFSSTAQQRFSEFAKVDRLPSETIEEIWANRSLKPFRYVSKEQIRFHSCPPLQLFINLMDKLKLNIRANDMVRLFTRPSLNCRRSFSCNRTFENY